jgi:lipid A ethanolaminephosphotransferase
MTHPDQAPPPATLPRRIIPRTANGMILAVVAFILATGNLAFFSRVLATYPPTAGNTMALLSLVPVLGAATVLLLAPLCLGRLTRPVLILTLLLAAPAAYFMAAYGVVIDDGMLRNVVQTDAREVRDLLGFKLLAHGIGLGLIPAWLVARAPLPRRGWLKEAMDRLKLLALALIVLVGTVLPFGGFYASFVREHKELRGYANPAYPVYSAFKFAKAALGFNQAIAAIKPIGLDARRAPGVRRKLVILVVGEAVRADHFGLNGYARETTPRLRAAGVVNFPYFLACGTSTAASVPCMFSLAGSTGSAEGRENLLDVLRHAGVDVLWLDNNSDSKGVALRVPYRDFKLPENNPQCDIECRDAGMLAPLQAHIDSRAEGDILIVLHQMGNHGPAYYKRYSAGFEIFTPACKYNDLHACTREEIVNAYDNALRYTDDFLGGTIDLLKANDGRFATALFYVSDHGESLGEGGVYLHGLPKAIAPAAQLHVPAVLWLGSRYADIDRTVLDTLRQRRFSHDNLFHTVLGLLDIETTLYKPEQDILAASRTKPAS